MNKQELMALLAGAAGKLLPDANAEHPPSLMSTDDFRQHVKSGDVPAGVLLRKQFATQVQKSEKYQDLYVFVVSTGVIDRDDDRISVDGWDLANYLKNPVMLWAHNYRGLPIGKAKEVFVEDGKLKALTEFTSKELNPDGDQIRQLYEQGFLSAVSVGFQPRKWSYVDTDERKYGIDFEEQEMLEFSGVTVPANSEALIERLAKALSRESRGELGERPSKSAREIARRRLQLERLRV